MYLQIIPNITHLKLQGHIIYNFFVLHFPVQYTFAYLFLYHPPYQLNGCLLTLSPDKTYNVY